jgi:hypothetical protein
MYICPLGQLIGECLAAIILKDTSICTLNFIKVFSRTAPSTVTGSFEEAWNNYILESPKVPEWTKVLLLTQGTV